MKPAASGSLSDSPRGRGSKRVGILLTDNQLPGKPSASTGQPVPKAVIYAKVGGILKAYLEQHGATRGVMDIKDTDTKQLPQSSIPSYLHLALTQISNHPALPYAGNTSAFVRDAVYLLMLAYVDAIEDFDLGNEDSAFVAHIIRREEATRRFAYIETIGLAQIADLAALAQLIDLARVAGEKARVYDLFRQLFHHVDNLPDNTYRHQFLLFIAGVPEFREALSQLDNDFKYHIDHTVQGWISRIEHIDDSKEAK